MNLLIATDNFFPRVDGVSVMLNEIIPFFSEKYKVDIIAPDFKGSKKFDISEVDVARMPLSKIKYGDYNLAKVDKVLLKEWINNNDLVWVHALGPIGKETIKICKKLKKKVICTVHTIDWELFAGAVGLRGLFFLKWLIKRRVRKYYNMVDELLVSSDGIKKVLRSIGVNAKIGVVPLGIDLNKFVPVKDKIKAKEKLGFDKDLKVIVYVGRLAREKNLDDLFEAFKKLDGTLLLFVGDGLKSLKRKFGSYGMVVITGMVDNVVPYLQAADIYVMPSHTETSSLSTLEAMGCGLAIVSSGVGGMKDYLIEGFNCKLYKKGNVRDLSLKIEKLLRDEKLCLNLGLGARETAMSFSWKKTSLGVVKIFERVLKK